MRFKLSQHATYGEDMQTTLSRLATGVFIASTLTLTAQARQETPPTDLNAIYKCAQETDEAKRLACFDAATRDIKAAEDSGDLVTVTRKDVEEEQQSNFGFATNAFSSVRDLFIGGSDSDDLVDPVVTEPEVTETAEARTPNPNRSGGASFEAIDEITIPILKTEEFGYNRNRFFLANGQIWDQADSGRFRIPKEQNGERNVAEIRRGALGSFLMQINGSGKAITVKRRR